ncbi:hypothetical protein [Lentzea sp. NPDC004782]|uniref:hypothetical protein n=1 Tax=Lentzea sp. NPDC004782 TaxID=3154458 RepID=UPI00339F9E68
MRALVPGPVEVRPRQVVPVAARTMRDLAAATADDEMWLRAKELFAQLRAREAAELEGLGAAGWRSAL